MPPVAAPISEGKHKILYPSAEKQHFLFVVGMTLRWIFLLIAYLTTVQSTCDKNLIPDLSFKLSGFNIAFPCPSTKAIYRSTNRYVPKSVIATRLQIAGSDAILAIPRYKHGVPFTLGKVSLKTKGCKATMTPFPCWAINEEGNCNALQSVVDMVLDPMDVLWVLDVGIVNTLEQPVLRCPPKIVGVNVKSGIVMKIIDLAPFATSLSRLQYILVDYLPDGRAVAFVTDAGMGGIVVYDVIADKGFRVVLPPVITPENPTKDVLYAALLRKQSGNYVIFTYLSSNKIFAIREDHLISGRVSGTITEVANKPQPMILLGTDNGAALFFRYKGESDIYVWNTETPFCQQNSILVQNGDDCRLPTQVVPGYKKLMWTIESNFHDYVTNTDGGMGPSMAIHPVIKTYN